MQAGSIIRGPTGFAIIITIVALAAASIVIGAIIYPQQSAKINDLSLELESKSATIERQSQTISEGSSLIASQQQEIADKSIQLANLQGQIVDLFGEIESREKTIAETAEQADRLKVELADKQAELRQIQLQITKLQNEISLLQSEIKAKDEDIAQLILEKNAGRRVHVMHYGLGVSDNKGIVFPIEVEIIGSGNGHISVDVSNVQYEASFQGAVRTAVAVASEYTGVSVSNKDIIVRLVNTEDGLIEVDGPSAGAAITAIMVAGLAEKEIDQSVLVTGTIRSDGTIGKIGGLASKADAAAAFGAKTMLVPAGQEFLHGQIEIVGVADIGELAGHLVKG